MVWDGRILMEERRAKMRRIGKDRCDDYQAKSQGRSTAGTKGQNSPSRFKLSTEGLVCCYGVL